MNIAFGHTNMDFDCLGSLIMIKKLFPDYRLVKSSRIHPGTQSIFNFYENFFNFLEPADISQEKIENVIIVDTCMASRVSEYFSHIRESSPAIRVFDHHQGALCDISGALVEGCSCGANTSYLGKMTMQKGIKIEPEEATIALAAIYADTGRLIYDNVAREDYEVSAWLFEMGASLRLVRSFLDTVKEDKQIAVLNHLRPQMNSIQGNMILLSYHELEGNVAGLAAVVEKIMEIQNPDAYFAVFFVPKHKTLFIIARSQKEKIDLPALLSVYGGGGHKFAASAKITGLDEGEKFFREFCAYLQNSIEPAVTVSDIMTKNVFTIHETTSIIDASMYLERVDHTAVPVVDKNGDVSGMITLRDIMKGRKHGKMQAPVKAYMSRPVISAKSTATLREIERLFYNNKISHLPILDDEKLLGIVTRWDYLHFQKRAILEEDDKNKE